MKKKSDVGTGLVDVPDLFPLFSQLSGNLSHDIWLQRSCLTSRQQGRFEKGVPLPKKLYLSAPSQFCIRTKKVTGEIQRYQLSFFVSKGRASSGRILYPNRIAWLKRSCGNLLHRSAVEDLAGYLGKSLRVSADRDGSHEGELFLRKEVEAVWIAATLAAEERRRPCNWTLRNITLGLLSPSSGVPVFLNLQGHGRRVAGPSGDRAQKDEERTLCSRKSDTIQKYNLFTFSPHTGDPTPPRDSRADTVPILNSPWKIWGGAPRF